MSRRTMTYGVLPPREELDAALEEEAPQGFRLVDDERLGTCVLEPQQLWDELVRARAEYEEAGDDLAGAWCSDVLGTLGFEWV